MEHKGLNRNITLETIIKDFFAPKCTVVSFMYLFYLKINVEFPFALITINRKYKGTQRNTKEHKESQRNTKKH